MKNGSKKRRAWTSVQVRELKSLARKKTPAKKIAKDSEAHRRRDAAKGIQYRIVTRLARVTSQAQLELGCQQAPPLTCAGLSLFSRLLPPSASAPAAPKPATTS